MTGIDRLALGIAIAFVVAIACGVATPYAPTPIETINTPETWPTVTLALTGLILTGLAWTPTPNPQHMGGLTLVHFEGDVVTVDSEPVADVLIEIEAADNQSYTVRTDAGGLWNLDVPASARYALWCYTPAGYECFQGCEQHVTQGGIYEAVLRQLATATPRPGTATPTPKPTEFIIILPTETALPIPLGVAAWYMEMVEADGQIHCWAYRSDLNTTEIWAVPCLSPQVWRYSR